MREIRDLQWVRALKERPGCIPKGRPRGVKAKGIRFEEACAKEWSGGPAHGVWFEYEDAGGHGYAQMDFLWRLSEGFVVGEAKLTWRMEAYVQLRKLYFPLLRGLGVPVGGVVICRNVTRETPRAEVVGVLSEALDRARRGSIIPTLHLPLVGA